MHVLISPTNPQELLAGLTDLLGGSAQALVVADASLRPPVEAAVPTDFCGIIMPTSGSTGRPHWAMLPRSALVWAADASRARLGTATAWANPLPLSFIAGLMTMVRAIVAQRPYLAVASDLHDLPQPVEPSCLSLVPAQLHRALADLSLTARLKAFVSILVGGGALDPTLRRRAEVAGLAIHETYGMTETCGGIVWDGHPLDGVEVVVDASEQSGGRISLVTPSAFSGYWGEPTLTAATLRGQAVTTADRGRWSDGQLTVFGRIDQVVQSGGVKVDLAQLQQLLDDLFPDQVACLALPDPAWGSVIAVASTGPGLDDIRTALAGCITSAAQPRRWQGVTVLPRTHSGKLDRAALAAVWGQ
ncbi:MAG: AMP-binding protein [Propionibacteriaceae bacterium]|nr:AMP-binding protein [Propionibacteriaceae bacterium]